MTDKDKDARIAELENALEILCDSYSNFLGNVGNSPASPQWETIEEARSKLKPETMTTTDKPTEKQLSLMRHMLGINDPSVGHPEATRNYAAVESGDTDYAAMQAAGWVRLTQRADGGMFNYDYYAVTDEGRALAFASHRKIRDPKAKRVYGAFLTLRDCLPDLTFKEFLTDPEFKEHREKA